MQPPSGIATELDRDQWGENHLRVRLTCRIWRTPDTRVGSIRCAGELRKGERADAFGAQSPITTTLAGKRFKNTVDLLDW